MAKPPAKKITTQEHPHLVAEAIDRLTKQINRPKETKSASALKAVGVGFIALGNIAMGGLYFGQAFGGFEFTPSRAVAGFIVLVVFYFAGFMFIKYRR